MNKRATETVAKALTAAMSPEPEVAQPQRARSASFASVVADLKVNGDPAAKVMRIDSGMTLEEFNTARPTLSEKLRNTAQSSVSQAKRRLGAGADFSIEISDLTAKSGLHLIALVSRLA
jgi:hypothetical protein